MRMHFQGGGTTTKRKLGTKNAKKNLKKKLKTNLRLNRPKVGWPKLKKPNLTRWTPNIRKAANSKPKKNVPRRKQYPGYKAVPKK